MEVVPGLATSAEFTDETTAEVELREGVEWHDGEPFTPQDVQFSVEMFIEHESPQMSVFYRDLDPENPVEIVSEEGGGTLQFNLTRPAAIFNTVAMVRSVIFPEHIWGDVDDPTTFEPSGKDEIVGTGPWQFESWEQGSSLRLSRHENNWNWDESFRREHLGDQFASGPGAEELVWVNTGNIDSAIGALQQGEIDVINQRLTASQTQRAADHPDVESRVSRNYAPLHGMTDFSIPIIRDKEFRRAYLGHGIDVQGFIDSVLGGNALKARANVPVFPNGPFFNEEMPEFEFNPSRANQILDQAGYGTDGSGNRTYPEGDAWAAFVERVRNPNMTREDLGQPDFS
jgi:peptide/nickel transport system substrate-binding protein